MKAVIEAIEREIVKQRITELCSNQQGRHKLQEKSSVVVVAIAYQYKQLIVMLQSLRRIMLLWYQSRYM